MLTLVEEAKARHDAIKAAEINEREDLIMSVKSMYGTISLHLIHETAVLTCDQPRVQITPYHLREMADVIESWIPDA